MIARVFTVVVIALLSACGRTEVDRAQPARPDSSGQASDLPPPRAPAIHASSATTCSLDSKGVVTCWGYNAEGIYKPPEEAFRDLSMGAMQICGLRDDFTLRCWGGANKHNAPDPPPVKFRQVAMGTWRGCGLDIEGHVLCWGDPDFGATKAPPGKYTRISGKGAHSCALRAEDSHPVCWGLNDYGQASPPDEALSTISADDGLTCGLRPNGTAVCWGAFALVPPAPQGSLLAVEVGGAACFIHPDHHVSCSTASNGVTVDGPITKPPPPPGPFEQVAVGSLHACGLRPDGKIVCWGADPFGAATPPK